MGIRQIGLRIVLDSGTLQSDVLRFQKILSALNQQTGLKIGVTKVTGQNVDKVADGIAKINRNISAGINDLQRYVTLLSGIRGLNPGSGGSGGGGRVNGGSRTGTVDPTSNSALLSAFSGFIRGGQSFTSGIGAFASDIGRLGIGVGGPLFVGTQVVRGLIDATTVTKDFSAAQAELASVLGVTRNDVGELDDVARRLGETMALTATQVTEAETSLAKLGFTKDDIAVIVEDVARLSVALGVDTDRAATVAGAALRTYHLDASEAGRVTSVLGVTTTKSAATFQTLEQIMNQTAATANAFGLTIEDTAALVGKLKDAGLTDSVAATATRNILLNLSDSGGKLRETLAGIGVKEVKGLDGVLKALKALDTVGISLSQTLEVTDKRSVNAFNTFLRNTEGVQELRDGLEDVNDQFEVMEKERLNSLEGSLTLFRSKLESVYLDLGLEDALRGIIDAGTGLLGVLSDLGVAFTGYGSRSQEVLLENYESVYALLGVLAQENLSLAEKDKIVAKLKLNYEDYLDGLDLEKATTAEIIGLRSQLADLGAEKLIEIQNQEEYNRLLDEERSILGNIEKLRKNLSDGSTFLRGIRDFFNNKGLDAANAQLLGVNRQKLTTLQGIGPNNITVDQFQDLQNSSFGDFRLQRDASKLLQQVRDQSRAFKRNVQLEGVGSLTEDSLTTLFGRLDDPKVSEKEKKAIRLKAKEARDVLDAALADLENQRAGFAVGTQLRKNLEDEITRLQNLSSLSRENLGGVNVPGGRGGGGRSKKEEEILLEGSLAFLRKQLKDAQERLDKSNASDKTGLVGDINKIKKELEEAEKLIDNLYTSPKEQYDLDVEFYKNSLLTKQNFLKKTIKDEEELKLALRQEELEGQRAELELLIQYQNQVGEGTTNATERLEGVRYEIDAATEALNKYREAKAEDAKITGQINALDIDNYEKLQAEKNLIHAEALAERLKKEIEAETNPENRREKEDELTKVYSEIYQIRGQLATGFFEDQAEATKAFNTKIAALLAKGGKKELKEAERLTELEALLTEKRIAISDLATAKISGNSEAIAAAYKKLADAEAKLFNFGKGGGSDLFKLNKKTQVILSAIEQISGALAGFFSADIDADLEKEKQSLKEYYDAKIEAAKGNKDEEARLKKEYDQKEANAERAAAKRRQQLAIKEALIATALAIIRAPDQISRVAAAVVGGLQIATIRKQTFARGGYKTGFGRGIDITGESPVGDELHNGEYVVKRKVVERYPEIIRFLEQDRQRYLGYARGGYVGQGSARPHLVNDPNDSIDFEGFLADLTKVVYDSVYHGSAQGTEVGAEKGMTKNEGKRDAKRAALAVNTY